jgi:hypothetical protein
MRRALVLALVLVPEVASATVGGPTRVEVIGYAPIDRKIYWLARHEGEGDALPQLWFVRTDGAHAGEPIAVRSWYVERGPSFDDRLARLRRHVVAMTDVTSHWELATKPGKRVTWDGEPFGFGKRAGRRVRCELVDDRGASSADATEVTVYDSANVSIARAFEIPRGGAGVVVLRYLGDPFETGYDVDTVAPTRAR